MVNRLIFNKNWLNYWKAKTQLKFLVEAELMHEVFSYKRNLDELDLDHLSLLIYGFV